MKENERKRLFVDRKNIKKRSLITGISLSSAILAFFAVQTSVSADVGATNTSSNSNSYLINSVNTTETANSSVSSSSNVTNVESISTSKTISNDTSKSSSIVATSVSSAVAESSTEATHAVQSKVLAASAANSSVSYDSRVSEANVTSTSSQNAGHLDSVSIAGSKLTVSGWHATNYANSRENDFVIVFDKTKNTEITRAETQPLKRNDVKNVYPSLSDSELSGFNVSFNLTSDMVNDEIQIISRYSALSSGNDDYVDYWFDPIILNKNFGSLDSVQVTDNSELEVTGWNATDQSFGKQYHYIILYDNTTGKQITANQVSNLTRNDVSQVYGNVYDASFSGFSALFNVGSLSLSDNVSVVSRYSDSAIGNGETGNYVDHWFKLPAFDTSNKAYLDKLSFDGGKDLSVIGWNATNQSIGKPYHYVILFDETSGRQVGSVKSTVTRNDVASVYRGIKTAFNSGFNTTFSVNDSNVGHNLVIVSRYSTSGTGNGSTGTYVDYWFSPFMLNSSGYSIDHFSVNSTAETVHIDGWMASDSALNKNSAYIIILNRATGKEVVRQELSLTTRNDVSDVYGDIYNSRQSGFSVDLPITSGMSGETLQFILRFSGSDNGNSDYTDQYTGIYTMPNQNKGSFDSIQVNSDTINVTGWHAADGSYLKNYEYLIIVDMSGKEIERIKVDNSLLLRNDVRNAYPSIYNSKYSGFNAVITISNSMRSKYIRIIDRYTDDPSGNGNYVDYYSGNVSIGVSYNVTGNSINAYITANNLSHASIQTEIWSGYPTTDMNYEDGYAKPEGVVIHETATYYDSIQGEMNYAMNHYENAFVHSYVSDSQIINVANTNYKCWGSGEYGNGKFVQFEQIEVHSKSAFAYELNNAAYYTAYLLSEYNLVPSLCVNGSGTIWSHHDVSLYLGDTDHTDPDGYWDTNAKKYFGTSYTMNDFYELVKYYFAEM